MKKFSFVLTRSCVLAFGGLLAVGVVTNDVPAFLAGQAYAAEQTQETTVCDAGRDLTESTAKLRDLGVPRSVVLAQVEESGAPERGKKVMRALVDAVYASDLTPSAAAREFMLGCSAPRRAKASV